MEHERLFATPEELFAAFAEQMEDWIEGTPATLMQEMDKQFLLAWVDLATQAFQDPSRWADMVTRYPVDQARLWLEVWSGGPRTHEFESAQRRGDRRFSAEEWQANSVFNYLKGSYLLASNWLMQLADATHFDSKDKQRLLFYVKQFVDGMSPSNFVATNPEVITLALETHGRSLLDGLQNLLADMKKGHISMTDESAFTLGENLATTPGAVIYENSLMQVIQYQPTTRTVWKRPLLIIPPFINKFYILDLQPENSFVKYALDQGNAVFLISWVNPDAEQRNITWDDYIESGVFTAIKVIKKITAAKRVNALGWCVGGTLLASVLAVMHARKRRTIASATFFTTLLDFSEPGELGVFIDKTVLDQRQKKLERTGVFPGKDLALVFSLLRANDLIWSYVVNNYLKGKSPPPFDVLYWNSDPTNLPANLYVSYVRDMYLENKLVEPEALTMCGQAIDLRKVTTPSYFLSTINDHIAPWGATAEAIDLFSGPVEFVLGASGHIVGVINPPAKHKRSYWINGQRGRGPQHWLDTAISQPGSWWPHWSNWLKQFTGKGREAQKKLGNKDYPVIEAAPGRYVMKRS
jgi:polyhydroxyalkanoate synthase